MVKKFLRRKFLTFNDVIAPPPVATITLFSGLKFKIKRSSFLLKYASPNFSKISDIILFDSKGYHRSESFDHNLLEHVPNEVNKMIAGNIQIDDIPNFKNKDFHIDLSGSVENNEGNKDLNKIDKLLNLVAKI